MKSSIAVRIEVLVLYAVLFLSGLIRLPGVSPEVSQGVSPGFSIAATLARVLLYNIPSLILIWYLLLRVKSLKDWGIGLPNKNDLLAAVISLPALLFIGLTVAFTASQLNGTPEAMRLYTPYSVLGWIVLAISCLGTGYLEESFFRFYILSRREELGLSNTSALIFSTIIFAICHIHGGPWAFLNSFLAGIFLCFIFLRYRSLHGIAIAHGLYNLAVFINAS